MRTLEAYIDESGNTGIDLFKDINQPFFWTGSIILDSSAKYPYDVQELAKSVKKEELHGSELGLGRINEIAEKVIEMIEHVDARFHFTRTEKKHVPTMRFVDAILDNVNNAAVSHIHYQISMMRKILAAKIDFVFDEQDKIDFWAIHLSGDENQFKEFLSRFREKFIYKYPDSDRRGKSLILDAIEWGIRHPEDLITERTKKSKGVKDFKSIQYESPNLISVSMFLSGLHNYGKEYNRKVSKIVHDEQSQFGHYLQEVYRYLSRVNIKDPYDLFTIAENTQMFPKNLEFESSSNSPNIQLVDVCMWLLKQKIDSKKEIYGAAGELLETIINRSSIFHFSSEFLRAEANYFTTRIMSTPITEDELARAMAEISKLELSRKIRLEKEW